MPKAKRQSRRRGSVQELDPGRWAVVAPAGKDALSGKRLRVTRVVWGSKVDAERALTALLAEVDAGKHETAGTSAEAMTFGELVDRWLEGRAHEGLSSTTLARYGYAAQHVKEYLGDRRPQDITPQTLDALYNRLTKAGQTGSSIRKVHQVARGVCDMAIRYRLTTENPALDARPPAVEQAQTDAPSREEIFALIEEAEYQNPVLGMMFRLGCATGARRGELLALRWSDLDDGAVMVRRSLVLDGNALIERNVTKTKVGRRVSLDESTLAHLDAYRLYVTVACEEAGSTFDPKGFMFSVQPDGSKPYRPDSVTQWFARRAENLAIKTTFYQSTRHWHCSELVAAGHDLRTIADRVGNDPRILLSRYSHLRPGKDQESADFMGELLASQK